MEMDQRSLDFQFVRRCGSCQDSGQWRAIVSSDLHHASVRGDTNCLNAWIIVINISELEGGLNLV